MWNHSKSLWLTFWWIRLALAVWILLAVALPFCHLSLAALTVFYVMFVPVLTGLYGLDRLLTNIRCGVVFAADNVASLRLVSWACFFAALFLLLAAMLWPVLLLAAGCIGFLGLFVRVIKNMLYEAIALKEENDFTI